MNIKIEQDDNKIYARVTVPSIDKTKGERILVTLEHVEQELHKRGIKFGKCVEGRLNALWNTNENNLTGTWVFSVNKKSLAPLQKIADQTTQPKDVNVEPEILVRPEPTKRKRTSTRRSKKSYSETGLVK